MSDYIPWGHIIVAVLLIGIAATICFVMGAREMGESDERPAERHDDIY